jgi:hypothetical protein
MGIAASQDDDDNEATKTSFLKPQLPVLRGTPARRVYSYGAEVEPVPVASMRNLSRNEMVDLNLAINEALTREAESDSDDYYARQKKPRVQFAPENDGLQPSTRAKRAATPRKSKYHTPHYIMSATADNPTDTSAAKQKAAPQKPAAPLLEPSDDSDTDDARSFGIESDYYGDATIASTPGSSPAKKNGRAAKAAPAQKATPKPVPQRSNARQSSSPAQEETPGLRSSPRRMLRSKTRTGSDAVYKNVEESEDDEEYNEINDPLKRSGRQNKSSPPTHAPAPKATKGKPARRRPLASRNGNGGDPWFEETTPDINRPSLFTHAKRLVAAASPFRRRSSSPSDHSEADDAIQKDVEAPETDNLNENWGWSKPLQSWNFFYRNEPELEVVEPEEVEDEDDEETTLLSEEGHYATGVNWLQFLNPYTYFQAMWWLISAAYRTVTDTLDILFPPSLRDGFWMSLEKLLYLSAFVVALATLFSLAHVAIFGTSDVESGIGEWMTSPRVRWPSIDTLTDKVGDLVPSLSWPSIGRSSLLPDLTQLDNGDLSRLDEYLSRYQKEFERLQKAGKLHETSLKKLEAVVPKLVHVQLEDGRPVVAQEFWHALRDLIHREGDFLTLEKRGNSYEVSSEAHWQAIASKLTRDPTFNKQLNATFTGVEDRIKSGAAGFWDSWIKNNDAKIAEMLGSALDQIQSAGSQREFDKRLDKIVKQHIQDNNNHSTVVTRDEFLRHFKNEFATHRAEVRAELAELQPQLDQLVRQAAELGAQERPESMSKGEIVTLVHGLITKAMADVNLEAMAKGQIHSHWDSVLKHQVNYFGEGAGATIDGTHTSSTWEAPAGSRIFLQKGREAVLKPLPRTALKPWSDESDRWCAARSINHRGNPHGAILAVQLGHRIIPQHIVIEHILSGATTDPGARPKEIEVYADVDAQLRDLIRDFSATHFPDIYPVGDDNWNLTPAQFPERFVKIGQFVYEETQPHDGVQVHRLSDELLNLGVATDHVIVRAVSNYGATDHTCFYRVRLYGQKVQ